MSKIFDLPYELICKILLNNDVDEIKNNRFINRKIKGIIDTNKLLYKANYSIKENVGNMVLNNDDKYYTGIYGEFYDHVINCKPMPLRNLCIKKINGSKSVFCCLGFKVCNGFYARIDVHENELKSQMWVMKDTILERADLILNKKKAILNISCSEVDDGTFSYAMEIGYEILENWWKNEDEISLINMKMDKGRIFTYPQPESGEEEYYEKPKIIGISDSLLRLLEYFLSINKVQSFKMDVEMIQEELIKVNDFIWKCLCFRKYDEVIEFVV